MAPTFEPPRPGPTLSASQILALALPYFKSEERWSARMLLSAAVLLNLATVVFAVLYNQWYQLFYNALQDRDQVQFWHQLLRFAVLAFLNVACIVYRVYLVQMLEMRWRRWLTQEFLQKWLGQRVYYWMEMAGQLENADQRICEDVKRFVDGLIGLSLGFLNSIATLASFVVILWSLSGSLSFELFGVAVTIPGYMAWAALVYAIAGSVLTHRIGKPMIGINSDQIGLEADLRFRVQRLRENAEGVALYGGETSEQTTLTQHMKGIVHNWGILARAQKRLNWVSSGYVQLGLIFPFLTAAHRFFTGGINLGGLIQITDSFEKLRSALSWLVDNYASIANWAASTERLLVFKEGMNAILREQGARGGIQMQDAAPGEIKLEDCDLTTPDGRVIMNGVDFAVKQGDRLLLSGPSGSGKSTVFRAIAGIWPFGRGTVQRPASPHILFLPQKPYLPIASLRDAVAYPAAGGTFTDAAVVEALRLCRLPKLALRLDEVGNWAQQLSPGEQQRMAFARALLHKPRWLFLDESTSALDESAEHEMYRLIHKHLPATAIVSIAHRLSVMKYHDKHLSLEPGQVAEPVGLAA